MNDRFHVDHYTGEVRDRTDSLANDAYVAVLGLMHSGEAVVSIDATERGAVPTLRHATRPDLHATVGVERYETSTTAAFRRPMVCVSVLPSAKDQLRTSLRIVMGDPESLYADDATDMEVARAVLEATAVHYARAVEACRKASPDAVTSEVGDGPEITFDMNDHDAPMLVKAKETAALAALNPHADARTIVSMPTPWSTLKAYTKKGEPVETDAELALRVPVMIDFETRYAFTDGDGQGTSGMIMIMPVTTEVMAVGPMDRLRAMRNARNGTGDAMRLHAEPDQATIRALCA